LAAVPFVPVVFAQHFRTSVTESGELALRKGWLEKRSTGKFRRFQRRWFVLQGHYLKYFQVHVLHRPPPPLPWASAWE
jgi:hypothetical protein